MALANEASKDMRTFNEGLCDVIIYCSVIDSDESMNLKDSMQEISLT